MQNALKDNKNNNFIRLGGLAVILALAIHIVVNAVIKNFPDEGSSLAELQAYLIAESGNWAIVHGLRYVALAGLLIFAASLFMRIKGTSDRSAMGWGIVGLLGITVHVTNAFINNGIETMVFLNTEILSEKPDLFWLLFHTTRTIAAAEIAAWSVVIFGFSMAGLKSSTLPKTIAGLGLLSATACLLSGVFIVPILNGGSAGILMDIAALTGLAWFASVGVYMIIKGNS